MTDIRKPESVGDALKRKVLHILEEKPKEEKQPSNFGLYLAWGGFNLVYLLLDIGTSVMVAALTNPFYGVLTFFAGIAPFTVYEVLFMRAYNSGSQKWLSIIGAAASIFSTITLALIVGGINAIKYFQITTLPAWVPIALESILLIGIVAAVGVHGLIWIIYFFGDDGIRTKQKHTQNTAARKEKKGNLKMAKEDVADVIEMAKEIDEYEKSNLVEALSMAYEQLTGQTLITTSAPPAANPSPIKQTDLVKSPNGKEPVINP